MIADERGMSMVEVMVAMVLCVGALVAIHGTLDRGTRSSLGHQQQVQGLAIAQREIEAARQTVVQSGFGALALRSAPVAVADASANPSDPRAFVTPDGRWKVMENFHDAGHGPATGTPAGGEPLLVDTVNGRVDGFTAGVQAGATQADVHRFVSERTQPCVTGGNCAGESRRLTVAVVIRQRGNDTALLPAKPVYLSTVLNAPVPRDQPGDPGMGLRIGVGLP